MPRPELKTPDAKSLTESASFGKLFFPYLIISGKLGISIHEKDMPKTKFPIAIKIKELYDPIIHIDISYFGR
jgi:hypothetical protein